MAGGRKIAEIQGIGSGVINCVTGSSIVEMMIDNVMYVPTHCSNLLSVKKLLKEGYKLTFDDVECMVKKNNNLQATARLST